MDNKNQLIKNELRQYYKSVLSKAENSILEQYEIKLAENIECLAAGNSFFELPMKNIYNIVKKVDFSNMAPQRSEKIIQNLISKTTSHHGDESCLLLNSIHCNDCDYSFSQYMHMLKLFTTSEMCFRMYKLYEDMESNSVNYDYEYELDQLKKENSKLAAQLSVQSKTELHQLFPPVKEQPADYEPNFYKAVKNGKLSSVQYTIEQGSIEQSSFISTDNYLHLAVQYGHLDIVQYLIQQCAFNKEARDMKNNTPLHIAAREGHLPIVIYLIEKVYVNRESVNDDQFTPLHCACQRFHFEVITYLISKQHVNIEASTLSYWRPIHFAAVNGSISFIRFICEQKPDIEAKTNDGSTPLLLAVRYGNLAAVKYFIEEIKVNINAVENNGYTALHVASFYGQYQIVKYLTTTSLDKNIRDYQNRRAFKLTCRAAGANQNFYDDIRELLV